MTKLVYISGAHGVGKDTIIRVLAQRLENTGSRVWVLREMPFPPDMKTGTMDFQLRYKRVMELREKLIDTMINMDCFDYIICNRHPIDVEIYSNRLTGERITIDKYIKPHLDITRILITCPSTIVKGRIEKRLEVDTHRKEWNETDMEYFNEIQHRFKEVNAVPFVSHFFREIENIGTVDKAVDKIMEWLL